MAKTRYPSFEKVVLFTRQLNVLKNVRIFEHLPNDALTDLSRRMTLRRFESGSMITAQDSPGTALHIIFEGQVKVVLFGENGREITLSLLNESDFFGEVALLDGRARSANAVAVGETAVLVLEREAFLEHLSAFPQTAMSLLAEMAQRLRRADELIGGLALQDVSDRLRRTLVSLAEERGENSEDGVMIKRRPTQQDLANMVGTCRETVSRTLSSLARQGLVVSKGRTLVLRPALFDSMVAAKAA